MAAPNSQISMLVTSCGRHDLLKQSLESFYAHTDIEPQELVVFEDGDTPMPEWLKTAEWRGRNVRWVSDGVRRGQAYACTRLIDEARYPLVFWSEDDWLFTQGDFMQKSKDILLKYPKIIKVSLRGNTGWHPLADPDEIDPNAKFKLAMPFWKGVWGGWLWNPSLGRLSDLRQIKDRLARHIGIGGLEAEKQISKELLDEGYRIADLNREIVTHTGGTRSVAYQEIPKPPRVLIAVPACFKFSYTKWESSDSPHFDQSQAWQGQPYGKDIHISGDNDRVEAVRATWAADAAALPNVDVKFFYGEPPSGFPRAPLPDEVFLPHVPDDYAGLPKKSIAIGRWALAQEYDFVIKVDDDSYVWVDRALVEIMSQRTLDYGGWLNGLVAQGGAGYWLSRRAMRLVDQNPLDSEWAEDVTIGKIMHYAGITPVMLPTHRSGMSDHWFFPEKFDATKLRGDEVCIHAVQPHMMHEIHKHMRGE